MPYPGMNAKETAWMDACRKAITGTNKRTGQPYTDGDKIAICRAQMNKTGTGKSNLIEIDKDVFDRIDLVALMATTKLINFGKAKNTREAQSVYQSLLEKANYDLDEVMKLV